MHLQVSKTRLVMAIILDRRQNSVGIPTISQNSNLMPQMRGFHRQDYWFQLLVGYDVAEVTICLCTTTYSFCETRTRVFRAELRNIWMLSSFLVRPRPHDRQRELCEMKAENSLARIPRLLAVAKEAFLRAFFTNKSTITLGVTSWAVLVVSLPAFNAPHRQKLPKVVRSLLGIHLRDACHSDCLLSS
jgi:hypothetical protein